ncbi:MAG: hypothetical protein JO356_15680 [Acidobacteria bacterium]|nr:hypothetical protein [Acidobacteriota bacterium]
MSLLDQLGNVLKQYTGESPQDSSNAAQHFDQVAQAAPQGLLGEGLSALFRSNQTPPFGNLVSTLFSQSNPDQKAGLLNHLMASLGPGNFEQLGGGVLGNLLAGGQKQITPQQAQSISPATVEQIATHAEKRDPSIVDKAGDFYAQHPALVKTLGGAALSIALAKMAERQRAA